MMRPLHRPEEVFSLRHLPSWMLLTAAAGMVNATALLATQQFVTHVTGTATRLGMAFASVWLAVDLAIVLGFFVLGAMAASCLVDVRASHGKRPFYSLPLFGTAGLVALSAVGGNLGWFGPFGGKIDEPADFFLLSALSYAMGLQNAAVATSTGLVVRTTHLTGPATDLGVHLAELLFGGNAAGRAHAKRHAFLRAGKIVSFVLGAALAVRLSRALEYTAFLFPAAAILLANLLSFIVSAAHHDEIEARA